MASTAEQKEKLASALEVGDEAAVQEHGMALAHRAADDFPFFRGVLNMLGYAGRLSLLNEMMRVAWPHVQEAAAYSPQAVASYAARAADHLIYERLTEDEAANGPDPSFLARLEEYFPIAPERLQLYLLLLSGRQGRRWQQSDFAALEMASLSGLMLEFMGFVWRVAGVPYSRSHLAREHLPRYFLDREAGNLMPPMAGAGIEAMVRRQRAMEAPQAFTLLPDGETIRVYLERQLQTIAPQPYAAAAILQLLPLWLDFLQVRGLATAEETAPARADYRQLVDALAPAIAGATLPAVAHSLDQWL